MKKKCAKTFLIGLFILFQTGCNDITVGPEPANTPEKNFELLWQEYDRMYGLFEIKKVDWNQVYQQYRPQVKPGMSDDALFVVFSNVLGELHDGHVWLLKPGADYKRYDSGPAYQRGDFSIGVVKKYLEVVKEINGDDGVNIVYGRLAGNIGYIHFVNLGMSPNFYKKAMDDILATLTDTKGLIVDARDLDGGDDRSSQHIAGRFASIRSLYMTTRFRNGPSHTDFTSPIEWYVEPTGKNQYTKPVVLLTNRITESAGESFTLAMKECVNVIHMGDTTYGIFSENPRRELPNGWIYTISVGDYRDANGQSYEDIGIAPQVVIQNKKEDILAGKDETLEAALGQ